MRASASRLRAAVGALDRDQRFAAAAAAALLLTMFLPWYEKSVHPAGSRTFVNDSISAFGVVSFVEAAIFLVAAGVLVLVLTRAEGGRYHLPGGDGTVILAAGVWAASLIFYRVLDPPSVSGEGAGATVGAQWGVIFAFLAAGMLAFAGQRMRVAARSAQPVRASRTRRPPPSDEELVTWSEAPTSVVPAEPRRRRSKVPSQDAPPRPDAPPPRDEPPPDASAPASDAPAPAPDAPPPPHAAPALPRPRDRAVRREDAERIEVDDPPDAPLLPGEIRRAQDRRV